MTPQKLFDKKLIESGIKEEAIKPIKGIDFIFELKAVNSTQFPSMVSSIPALVSINEGEAFVTMRANDWLSLIKETSRVNKVFCPSCKSSNVSKKGFDRKFVHRRYNCNNDECPVSAFTIPSNTHHD